MSQLYVAASLSQHRISIRFIESGTGTRLNFIWAEYFGKRFLAENKNRLFYEIIVLFKDWTNSDETSRFFY